jgi:hypothetical protein
MKTAIVIVAFTFLPLAARAEQPKVQVDSIISGLDNPTAVVLRPGTDELLVSESGAGRILRVAVGSPAKSTPLITGFPVADAPAGLGFRVGPLGIAFIDRNVFVVGSGGSKLGQEVVRLFTMPSADKTLTVDSAQQSLGPFPASSESTTGEGFFYSVLTLPEMVLVTSHGDDAGYVLRSVSLQGKTFSGLRPLIKTKALTGAGNPTALAITKRGELVVGQSGSFDKPNDAMLSFFNPKNGKLLLTLPTGMHDIFALAYHPQSGNLYALDFAFAEGKDAGLYRIDAAKKDGKPAAVGVKIATLQRPTAMAFNGDGALYVTVLGDAKQAGAKSGQLLKITGLQ